MALIESSQVYKYNGLALNYIVYPAGSSLNTVLKAIDTKLGVLVNNPPGINSSKVDTYDGDLVFSADIEYPAGSLNDVLEYIGETLALYKDIFNLGGAGIDIDPEDEYNLPVNNPIYVYPTIPSTVPSIVPEDGYVYPPSTGIDNYNPEDDTIAGHLKGVIESLDYSNAYANSRPDYNYLRSTISGISNDFVKNIGTIGWSLLSFTIGEHTFYISGRRIYKPFSVITLFALNDNYIDISYAGVYANNHVPAGDTAPSIAANSIRLYKLTTDGTEVISSEDLRASYPIDNALLGDNVVEERNILNESVTGDKLEPYGPGVQTEDFATITTDLKGRVTLMSSKVQITGLAHKDILEYDEVEEKWINVPKTSVLPLSADIGDFLMWNGTTWEAATVVTPLYLAFATQFTYFKPNATNVGTITLMSMPAGFIPTCVKIKHSFPFIGGTTSAALLKVKDSNGVDYSNGGMDVFQAAGNTVGIFNTNISASSIPNNAAVSNLSAELTIAGDVIDNLIQGSVEIFIGYVILK